MNYIIDGFRVIKNDRPSNKKPVDYKLWKSLYIVENNVNLNEIIYTGVVRDKFIQLTYGKLLDLGDSFPDLGRHIQQIAMKDFYTGRNPRKKYKELLDNILFREHSELFNLL